jgi:hypothetical protein
VNAVTYAENALQVHAVWEALHQNLELHDSMTGDLMQAKADLRLLEYELQELTDALLVNVWEHHNESSSAEKEREVRVATAKNSTVARKRDDIRKVRTLIDSIELQLANVKLHIQSSQSRLHELGGLLFFYGVAKQEKML